LRCHVSKRIGAGSARTFHHPHLNPACLVPAQARSDVAGVVSAAERKVVMTKIAVVFQSGRGHTKLVADTILRGLNEVEGVSGQIFEILGRDIHEGRFKNSELMTALDGSDGIVFGCATYMGSVSAVFKAFLEAAFQPHWLEQRWKDKIAAGFTNSASQNGDKLSTLFQLTVFAMQMGMIWVGVGDLPGNNWSGGARTDLNRLGTWLGAMGQSNADEDKPSSEAVRQPRCVDHPSL
jgi:NAD(P)H dehydrogenase (quinone)